MLGVPDLGIKIPKLGWSVPIEIDTVGILRTFSASNRSFSTTVPLSVSTTKDCKEPWVVWLSAYTKKAKF